MTDTVTDTENKTYWEAKDLSRHLSAVSAVALADMGTGNSAETDHRKLVDDDHFAAGPWTMGDRPGWTRLKSANTAFSNPLVSQQEPRVSSSPHSHNSLTKKRRSPASRGLRNGT